jgi:hypothetical protein
VIKRNIRIDEKEKAMKNKERAIKRAKTKAKS